MAACNEGGLIQIDGEDFIRLINLRARMLMILFD
jgi:hypothetical protein